ncbi:uncharacterized protein [Emydura macquarii macquarii]|uniref:uncharacterized protein n=1 Tax=Emydura macquarii macquarii TaxID=1129001 RepID=UPI00352A2C57
MDPERPACAPPPCTLHPSNEPGFMSLPFFPPCDSTTSWDLCAPVPAAESLGTWENSSLWDGGSLLITGSSQGHLETPEEASFISLQSPLDPTRFPLAQPWDGLSPDTPTDAAPDFVHPPVTAARLDPDVDEVLAHVSHILSCHPKGMRVKWLVRALMKERGVDLWAFSRGDGFRGVVSFLREVPGIQLWNPERGEKCRVLSCTFKKDVADPLPLLCSTLGSFPDGLRVFSLWKVMWQRHGVNLEAYSQQRGYVGTLDYLTSLPEVRLQGLERGDKCLVQLQTAASIPTLPPLDPAGFPSPQFCTGPTPDGPPDAAPNPTQPPVAAACLDPTDLWLTSKTNPDVADPLPLLCSTLGSFPDGLRVVSLRKAMWQRHGVNLEAYSQQRGYVGTLDYLTSLPEVRLQGLERGDKCLIQLQTGVAVTPPTPQLPPDPALPSAWDSSTPPPDAPDAPSPPADVEPMEAPGQAPDAAVSPMAPARQPKCCCLVADVGTMALLIQDVLAPLPQGMRVKKLTEALARKHGVDLEAFSQDKGYKDVVSFLGDVPGLSLQAPEKGKNCLVRLWTEVAVTPPTPQLPPDPAPPSALDSSTPPPDAPDAPSPPADVEPMEVPGQAPGLAEVSASVREVLGRFPLGLKVGKLKVALQREHGLDLEVLSRQQGCGDALGLLRGLPHLWLQDPGKGDACLAWLGTGRCGR